MKRDKPDKLIDLGAASRETKGGPYGSEDFWGTLMNREAGLARD